MSTTTNHASTNGSPGTALVTIAGLRKVRRSARLSEGRLTETERKILAAAEELAPEGGFLSSSRVAEHLGMLRETVRNYIKYLAKAKLWRWERYPERVAGGDAAAALVPAVAPESVEKLVARERRLVVAAMHIRPDGGLLSARELARFLGMQRDTVYNQVTPLRRRGLWPWQWENTTRDSGFVKPLPRYAVRILNAASRMAPMGGPIDMHALGRRVDYARHDLDEGIAILSKVGLWWWREDFLAPAPLRPAPAQPIEPCDRGESTVERDVFDLSRKLADMFGRHDRQTVERAVQMAYLATAVPADS